MADASATTAPRGDDAEEYARKEWVKYYVDIGDFASARALGWDGEPVSGAEQSAHVEPSERRPITDDDAAAVVIQAQYRGWSRRVKFRDERDEAARIEWINYYVKTRQYAAARAFGWDGTEPTTETELAAGTIQRHYRGYQQREDYKDVRDEEARQQWVAYYVRTGQVEKAIELGYEPPSLPAVPKLPLTERALASSTSKQPRALSCFESVAGFVTPRKVKARRELEMHSVVIVQRMARGMLARARARLLLRENLLYELVNRQEERHAKRIEYYVNMFLITRERNTGYHQQASAIQAGYRGRRGRMTARERAAERDAVRAAEKARADAAAREAEAQRQRDADAERQRAAAAATTSARDELEEPRPVDVYDGMAAAELNDALERSARTAARNNAAKRRADELATRMMQNVRGFLKKTSPKARLALGSTHTRYFYFEADRLCWRKSADEEEDEAEKKFMELSSIESVAALDPIDKFEFAIKLRGLNKPYRMRAATEAELLMWVQALKTLLAVRAETARR